MMVRRVLQVTLALVSSVVALGTYESIDALKGLDSVWYQSSFRSHEELSDKLVVVAITEGDLEKYGPWPWDRGVISALIEQVLRNSPRLLAVDIAFVERTSEDQDKRLANALVSDTTVVLGQPPERQIISAFRQTGVRVGSMGFGSAPELPIGVIAVPYEVAGTPSLAATVASILNLEVDSAARHPFHLFTQGYFGFAYASTVNGFTAADVLESVDDLKSMEGKIVMLGVTAESGKDYHFTPKYATSRSYTSGVVVWANAIDALITKRRIQGIHPAIMFSLLLIAAFFMTALASDKLTHRIALALGVAIGVALIGKFVLVPWAGLVMPVVPWVTNGLLVALLAKQTDRETEAV